MEKLLDIKEQLQPDQNSSDFQIIYNDWLNINKNIKTILECTEESMFFIDAKLNIELQYSKSLEKAFNQKKLSNQSFLSLLEDRIPNSVIKDTQEYIELMFKDELDTEIIN